MKNNSKIIKENPTSKNLGFVLSRIFLGVSSLKASTISFRLRFSLLSLRDNISDCEGVLGWLVLHWWLSLLVHSFPPRNVGVKKGSLGRKKLLDKRVRVWNLLNILWEEDILGPPRLGVYRDS